MVLDNNVGGGLGVVAHRRQECSCICYRCNHFHVAPAQHHAGFENSLFVWVVAFIVVDMLEISLLIFCGRESPPRPRRAGLDVDLETLPHKVGGLENLLLFNREDVVDKVAYNWPRVGTQNQFESVRD